MANAEFLLLFTDHLVARGTFHNNEVDVDTEVAELVRAGRNVFDQIADVGKPRKHHVMQRLDQTNEMQKEVLRRRPTPVELTCAFIEEFIAVAAIMTVGKENEICNGNSNDKDRIRASFVRGVMTPIQIVRLLHKAKASGDVIPYLTEYDELLQASLFSTYIDETNPQPTQDLACIVKSVNPLYGFRESPEQIVKLADVLGDGTAFMNWYAYGAPECGSQMVPYAYWSGAELSAQLYQQVYPLAQVVWSGASVA